MLPNNKAQDKANEIKDRVEREIEELAAELCNTYYVTVDPRPERQSPRMWDKITEPTREHWRAQARLMRARGWRRTTRGWPVAPVYGFRQRSEGS